MNLNILLNISIGIASSIIAAFLCWLFTQIYSLNTRKYINYKIIVLRKNNYSYQKFLEYQDYDLALMQVHRMLDIIGEIYASIKVFTYLFRKKKLILTLLNNLYIQISRFQNYYKGYEPKDEKEFCCYEAKRHLYTVGFKASEDGCHPDPNQFQSCSEVAIELLSDLNLSKKSVVKIMYKSWCFNGDMDLEIRKQYFIDLIDIHSFQDSYHPQVAKQVFLSTKGYKKKEYENLIKKLKNFD